MSKKNNTFLYFITFTLAFLVGLSLAFSSQYIVNADTINTYNYDLTFVENSNSFQVGGISDIRDLSFNYTFCYKFTYTTTSSEVVLRFIGSSNSSIAYSGNLFYFNHSNSAIAESESNLMYNIAIRVKDGSTGSISLGPNSGSSSTTRKITLSSGIYDVYFTTGAIIGNYSTFRILPTYYTAGSNSLIYFGRGRSILFNNYTDFTNSSLSDLVDNNANTNFNFKINELIYRMSIATGGIINVNQGDTGFDIKPFNNFYVNNSNISFTFPNYSTLSLGYLYLNETATISSVTTWYNVTYCNFNFNNISNYSINLVSDKIYFNINKPTYRFNSSLTIYNYDYLQLLNSVVQINYKMSRNNDIYSLTFPSSLPNYRNLIFFNNDIKNIQFDQYIDFTMYFNQPINLNILNFDTLSTDIFEFGFDFNFDQYLSSLVIGDGSFSDFDTYKPQYVAMNFSLTPLYIPILEGLQNIFIFIIYDMPLFNDVFRILGFSNLFNLLVSIFNFISLFIDLSTVNFISGIIAFFVSFNILKTLVPVAYSSVSSYSKNIYRESLKSQKNESLKKNKKQ